MDPNGLTGGIFYNYTWYLRYLTRDIIVLLNSRSLQKEAGLAGIGAARGVDAFLIGNPQTRMVSIPLPRRARPYLPNSTAWSVG